MFPILVSWTLSLRTRPSFRAGKIRGKRHPKAQDTDHLQDFPCIDILLEYAEVPTSLVMRDCSLELLILYGKVFPGCGNGGGLYIFGEDSLFGAASPLWKSGIMDVYWLWGIALFLLMLDHGVRS